MVTFDPFKINDPIYQRYGLGLHVSKWLFAGFNLKTLRHVANLLEQRLAWGLWRKSWGSGMRDNRKIDRHPQ